MFSTTIPNLIISLPKHPLPVLSIGKNLFPFPTSSNKNLQHHPPPKKTNNVVLLLSPHPLLPSSLFRLYVRFLRRRISRPAQRVQESRIHLCRPSRPTITLWARRRTCRPADWSQSLGAALGSRGGSVSGRFSFFARCVLVLRPGYFTEFCKRCLVGKEKEKGKEKEGIASDVIRDCFRCLTHFPL